MGGEARPSRMIGADSEEKRNPMWEVFEYLLIKTVVLYFPSFSRGTAGGGGVGGHGGRKHS